jgi:DNA-binding CsgD family transcriptional regulator/response regulator RpfG family c-di-GMP phosphodiesterase
MNADKLIVIGCDETAALSTILNSMRGFSYHIVSATKMSDLIGIVKSLNPDLVIINFRSNQFALNDFITFIRRPEIPILCLTRKQEQESLSWSDTLIVFTYPYESMGNEKYLRSRINSIFLLKESASKNTTDITLARAAIHQDKESNEEGRNLSRYVLELDQKVEILLKVKDRIANLCGKVDDHVRGELTSIVNSIKKSANDHKLWEDFKLYFEQTDPDFLKVLSKKYPVLTPVDLKYCCYLKMNMSNDDIRNLLAINQDSVRTHKYRLKKKMSLGKEQDLRSYLKAVGQH